MRMRRMAAALLAALALAAWAAAPGADALAMETGYFGSGHEAGQGHRV